MRYFDQKLTNYVDFRRVGKLSLDDGYNIFTRYDLFHYGYV